MREALDRMRPLASDAVLAMFQIAMGEATEKAGEQTLRNAGKGSEEAREAPRSLSDAREKAKRPTRASVRKSEATRHLRCRTGSIVAVVQEASARHSPQALVASMYLSKACSAGVPVVVRQAMARRSTGSSS